MTPFLAQSTDLYTGFINIAGIMAVMGVGLYLGKRCGNTWGLLAGSGTAAFWSICFSKRFNRMAYDMTEEKVPKNSLEFLLSYTEERLLELTGPEITISRISRERVDEALLSFDCPYHNQIRNSLPALDSLPPQVLEKFSALFIHDGMNGVVKFVRTETLEGDSDRVICLRICET